MDEINGNVASAVRSYDVQPVYSSTGWGTIHPNTSVTAENFIIGGKVISEVGLGLDAPSQVVYRINREAVQTLQSVLLWIKTNQKRNL